jgi:hypothetical protein
MQAKRVDAGKKATYLTVAGFGKAWTWFNLHHAVDSSP